MTTIILFCSLSTDPHATSDGSWKEKLEDFSGAVVAPSVETQCQEEVVLQLMLQITPLREIQRVLRNNKAQNPTRFWQDICRNIKIDNIKVTKEE